jgi:hypothetical protein
MGRSSPEKPEKRKTLKSTPSKISRRHFIVAHIAAFIHLALRPGRALARGIGVGFWRPTGPVITTYVSQMFLRVGTSSSPSGSFMTQMFLKVGVSSAPSGTQVTQVSIRVAVLQ